MPKTPSRRKRNIKQKGPLAKRRGKHLAKPPQTTAILEAPKNKAVTFKEEEQQQLGR